MYSQPEKINTCTQNLTKNLARIGPKGLPKHIKLETRKKNGYRQTKAKTELNLDQVDGLNYCRYEMMMNVYKIKLIITFCERK